MSIGKKITITNSTEAKKAEPKKTTKTSTTTKKPTAKKTPAKKPTVKKAASKTTEIKQNVYVQFPGREVLAKDVVARIKSVWTGEMNKKISEMKTLDVYLNTTEYKAYYVINDDVTGSMDI